MLKKISSCINFLYINRLYFISEKFKTRTFPYSVNMVFVQVMFVKVEVMLVQVNQFVQVNHFVNLFVNLFAQIM